MHGKRDSEAQTVCMERQTVRHRLCAWKDRDSEEQTVCMERQETDSGAQTEGEKVLQPTVFKPNWCKR